MWKKIEECWEHFANLRHCNAVELSVCRVWEWFARSDLCVPGSNVPLQHLPHPLFLSSCMWCAERSVGNYPSQTLCYQTPHSSFVRRDIFAAWVWIQREYWREKKTQKIPGNWCASETDGFRRRSMQANITKTYHRQSSSLLLPLPSVRASRHFLTRAWSVGIFLLALFEFWSFRRLLVDHVWGRHAMVRFKSIISHVPALTKKLFLKKLTYKKFGEICIHHAFQLRQKG